MSEAEIPPADAVADLQVSSELLEADFRRVMGNYCTGLAAITAISDGEPVGMVVQSIVSLSLQPPLLMFAPSKASTSWPRIRACGRFCVNVLAEDQEEISRRFAIPGGDKFESTAWQTSPLGNPVLDGVLAWMDCTTEAEHPAGDHTIVVGRVFALNAVRPHGPLVFFRGMYSRLDAGDRAS